MSAEISSNIAEGILQAAVRLFARKGYEATSTREIVEAAGVTKPMIYYYFKNKEGLYEAVLTRFLSQFAVRLRAVVDEPRAARPPGRGRVGPPGVLSRAPRLCQVLLRRPFWSRGKRGRGLAGEYDAQVQDLLIEACQRAVANGLVKPERMEALVTALQAMINLWVIATVKEGAVLARGLAVQIVDIVLDGVAH